MAIYIWTSFLQPQPNALADFLYYSISYVLIVVIARNLGNEISVQFEASRRMGQVDDLKNQFLAVTSHYLRTPISIIKGSVEEMSKQALSSDAKVDIENIKTSTAKLEMLVEKFLKVSSIEKGQISITKWPGDLNNLLITIVNELQPLAKAKPKPVTLIYQPAPHLNFSFDPVNLKEALVSVIDNAIKFNRPGGQVIISLNRDKDNAIIQIADSGIGINKEHMETLFSTFNRGSMEETLKFDQPGLGLGLYLTKLIVEAHGGTIRAESMEGKGSTFTLKIPIV